MPSQSITDWPAVQKVLRGLLGKHQFGSRSKGHFQNNRKGSLARSVELQGHVIPAGTEFIICRAPVLDKPGSAKKQRAVVIGVFYLEDRHLTVRSDGLLIEKPLVIHYPRYQSRLLAM